MTLLETFGGRARAIKDTVRSFATDAHCASIYVEDTIKGAGEADGDLLLAAQYLEDAARDLRTLRARIEQMRADRFNPVLIAAE